MRILALLAVLVATHLAGAGIAAAAAPAITGVSPQHGPVGTVVKITGSGFVQGMTKVFFGTTPAIEQLVLSGTSMQATAPDGTPTVRHVVVKTDAGSAQSPAVFTLSPTIASVSPSGSVGATVKVLGSGLGETSRVVFAGNAVGTVVSKAAGEVDVVVPSTARNGKLTLTTPGGTASTPVPFHVRPTVSGVSADSHTVGSAVTISGSGLADVMYVSINDANASFHVVSPNEIRATIPSDASPHGNVRVSAAPVASPT